ncbi:Hsp20 family protein [Amycolatopsis carbonis]|uniref:Hsp20 family protein n=1 Tax=Amycolatopsis carbonis TaxID=715471 RepID=A0A9Y2MS73_9PSEU|nr:Hsp20 family protein [Amycolatopsis sp. 2-15]WIX75623.1 Hsp20 family protein [Amycolatopsis sp. 2-15]
MTGLLPGSRMALPNIAAWLDQPWPFAEHIPGGGHSEFYYGKFSRTVPLPAGAEATKMNAKYADGILEITMPLAAQPHEKQIKIHVDKA